jgi:hypothetical protein
MAYLADVLTKIVTLTPNQIKSTETEFFRTRRNVVDVEVAGDDGERDLLLRLGGPLTEFDKLVLNLCHRFAHQIVLPLVGHHVQVGQVADASGPFL